MKKNILTLVLLVVVVITLVLQAIMMFTVVPAMQKVNKLVTDISSVLNLELAADEKDKVDKVPLEDLEFYDIDEEMTVGLQAGADGEDHYAVLKISISMNTKDKDYKTYGSNIDTKSSLIKNAVFDVVGKYTYESAQGKTVEMEKEILKKVQEAFDSEFIYQVIFSDVKIV